MEAATPKFEKRKGTSEIAGHFYEINLVMLLLLEKKHRVGLGKVDGFWLASNMKEAECFDDIVIMYNYKDANQETKSKICFLQAKHKDSEKHKICIDTLLSTKNNNFGLRKYFSGFINVMKQFSEDSSNPIFENTLPKELEFLIYTNASFNEKNDRGNIKKVKIEEDHFLNLTENTTFYYKLNYTDEVATFLNNSDESVSHESIKAFLQNLKIFANQPNEDYLAEIVKGNMRKYYNIQQSNIDTAFLHAKDKVLEWWKDKSDYIDYLTETNTFFEDSAKFSIHYDVRAPTDLFTGRKEELKKLHDLMQLNVNRAVVISQMTSICGLGGIGKTELARQYVTEYGKFYDDNVIWINAENDSTLTKSFQMLAEGKLNISTKTVDKNDKKIEFVIEEVYDFFAKRKCLFVFDNEENCENFIKFLPLHSLKSQDSRPYILITSRKREWENERIKVLHLNVLTKTEAIELVKKGLDFYNFDDNEIKKLVDKLQYFPLAMKQAIAYIRNEHKLGKFTIDDYLKKFEENTKDLLNFQQFQRIDDYTKTTYKTWKTTINKISKETNGHLAVKLLNTMAFISNENIKTEMFLNLFDIEERQLKLSIQLLINYSMINDEEQLSVLNIHKLVQEVTRIEVIERNEQLEVIEKCCEMLENYFPNGSNTMSDLRKKQQLLSHIEILVDHIDKYIYDKLLRDDCLEQILNILNDGYINFDIWKYKKVLERILSIQKEKYLPSASAEGIRLILGTMIELSRTNRILGDFENSKVLLEEALKIYQNHNVCDQILLSEIYENFGEYHNCLGNYRVQIKFTEKALELQEEYYGSENVDIISTILTLSDAYSFIGNAMKQKELLDRAVKITYENYNSTDIIKNLKDIASYCESLGDYQKQEEFLNGVYNMQIEDLGPDHYEVAETLIDLSKVYAALDDHEKQKEKLENAKEIYEKFYGPNHIDLIEVLELLSDAYGNLGQYHHQKELLEKILKYFENYYESNNNKIYSLSIELAFVYGYLREYQKRKDLLERRIELNEMHRDPNYDAICEILTLLGITYGDLGQPRKQKELLEKAVKIIENVDDVHKFILPETISSLGMAFGEIDELRKQKELLDKALEVCKIRYDPDHFKVFDILINIGFVCAMSGDLRTHKNLSEEALKRCETRYGIDSSEMREILLNLGDLYFELGNFEDQKSVLERALELYKKHYNSDHYKIATVLKELGGAHGGLGNTSKQAELLEKALKIQEKHYGSDNLEVADTSLVLSKAYNKLGNFISEIEYLEKVLGVYENYFGSNSLQLIVILEYISDAYGKLGDNSKHKDYLNRILYLQENHYNLEDLLKLARAYKESNNFEKQKEIVEQVLEIHEENYGCDSSYLLDTLEELTNICVKLNDESRRKEILERISAIELKVGLDNLHMENVI